MSDACNDERSTQRLYGHELTFILYRRQSAFPKPFPFASHQHRQAIQPARAPAAVMTRRTATLTPRAAATEMPME